MKKLKHFGSLIRIVFWEIVHAVRNKRTWVAVGIITFLYLYSWFWRNYYIQSPIKSIKWQCIVCRANQSPVASVSAQIVQPIPTVMALKPVLTEKEIVMSMEHGEDLYKLFFLESTLGKNDGCRKDGKYGGFGVMDRGQVVCYDTFEKAVERAEYWWSKLLINNTKTVAACIWNTGAPLTKCSYSDTFNSL